MNFWYPVCASDELHEKPLPVTLLGLKFAAFRDTRQQAHLVSDTCIHRGGSLSKGWVKDGCIVCPYHGWEYSGDGLCARIPSQKKGKTPGRAKIDSYPTEERYGLVFAFLGDLPENERPPIFPIPEWGQDGWRAGAPVWRDVNCYYERSVENGLDPYHNEFVHPSQGLPKIISESTVITEMDWGTHFIAHFGELGKKESGEDELEAVVGELRAGSLYHGPNTLVTDIHFTRATAFIQYGFEAPIDMNTTRLFLINMRNCMLDPKLDERVKEINARVADEDTVILENLWPVRTPDTTTKELLTSGDEMVLRYRAHLREWAKKGWQLDTAAMAQNAGNVAYAIPCPARRHSSNWILDEAPRRFT